MAVDNFSFKKHPGCPSQTRLTTRWFKSWDPGEIDGSPSYLCEECERYWTTRFVKDFKFCPTCGRKIIEVINE